MGDDTPAARWRLPPFPWRADHLDPRFPQPGMRVSDARGVVREVIALRSQPDGTGGRDFVVSWRDERGMRGQSWLPTWRLWVRGGEVLEPTSPLRRRGRLAG